MIDTLAVLYFFFIYFILVLTKTTFKIVSALLQTNPKQLVFSSWELIILGVSISYIFTYIKFI